MANEAYRAVFLRVHPTGKMVLSLTTESEGKEAEYAHRGGRAGVPHSTSRSFRDTDRFWVRLNTSPSRYRRRPAPRKIRAQPAGAALTHRRPHLDQTGVVRGVSVCSGVKTVETALLRTAPAPCWGSSRSSQTVYSD
jgi:hypothetical protein